MVTTRADLEDEFDRISIELARRESALARGEQEVARYEREIEGASGTQRFTRGLGFREMTQEAYRARLKREHAGAVRKLKELVLDANKARERRVAVERELLLLEDTPEDFEQRTDEDSSE